jgi:hypothetical protein
MTEQDIHCILAEIVREEGWKVYNPRVAEYILTASIPRTNVWFDLWIDPESGRVICDRYHSHPLTGGSFQELGYDSFDIADPTSFPRMVAYIKSAIGL